MIRRLDDRGKALAVTMAFSTLLVTTSIVGASPGAIPRAIADDRVAPSHTLAHLELAPGGAGARAVASDPLTHTLYVAEDTSLVAVDELTGASQRFGEALGGHFDHVVVDPMEHEVFATRADDYEGRWVVVFAEATLGTIATIPVSGNNASAIGVDHAAQAVVVVGRALGTAGGGMTTFINEAKNEVRSNAAVGNEPSAVAIDDSVGTVYVANSVDGTVSLLDVGTGAVFDTVATGDTPSGIGVDPESHRAYVANSGSDTVSAIASTRDPSSGVVTFTVMAATSVESAPWGVAVDPETQSVYVASEGSSEATVISEWSNTVAERVGPIESQPTAVTVDVSLHAAFVIARNSSTISVISPGLVLAPPRGCGLLWCS